MFSSLIPDLLATGADLTVECDPRLGPLLARSFPGLQTRRAENPAVPPGEGEFTYQVYGPDAARWFRNSFGSFPRHAGYLRADPELTGQLRQRYKKHGDRPIVGISWRTAINTKVSAPKTLELADWAPILRERDATFVCLQYGNPWTEVGGAARMLGTDIVCDATIDPVKDIDAFASQVAAMDLVITTSNATAHMAGSLDIPVWTLVPMGYGGMWHWFLERSDSPWYPSMRLFRQTTRGDWMPVLAEAAAMLTHFLAARRK